MFWVLKRTISLNDELENMHNYMLKNFDYLDLCATIWIARFFLCNSFSHEIIIFAGTVHGVRNISRPLRSLISGLYLTP